MDDPWIARIVALGLLGLALLATALTAWLLVNKVDAGPIAAIAASAGGALAAFFAGMQIQKAKE